MAKKFEIRRPETIVDDFLEKSAGVLFARDPFLGDGESNGDRVGSYGSDVTESYPESDTASPLVRELEGYSRFSGETLECLKKAWMEQDRGFFSDDYNMPGLWALYSRASTYVFGDWNKCGELMGLAPYGRRERQVADGHHRQSSHGPALVL